MRSRIWIVLHALVVLLPVIGAIAHAPDATRYGVELPADLPELSFGGWRGEKIQPAFQSWFERRIGFRGVMVRTDNSIQTTLLHETQPGSYVVVGNEGTYYSADDVRYMSTQRRDLPGIIGRVDELTTLLGSVHKKLAARGKSLIVVIAPSKSVIYPEAIPNRWQQGPVLSAAIHDALRGGLEKQGVPFGDADAIFTARPPGERELVFARKARHWTLVGACLALRDALVNGPVTLSCDYEMTSVSRADNLDFDLYRLQNIWGGDTGMGIVPLVKKPPKSEGGTTGPKKPRAIFAGTSFLWMLADLLGPHVDDKPIALFYNTTFFDLGTGQRIGHVDPTTPSWAEYVLERDLYVIDILETFAHYDEMRVFLAALDGRLQ